MSDDDAAPQADAPPPPEPEPEPGLEEEKPEAPPKAAAKKAAKAKAAKGPKDKKDAKAKGKKGKADASGAPSIASHPRAGRQVRLAKGWGGILAFAIAAYVSYRAGVPPEMIGIRALAAGACGFLLGWGCAVTVWRQLVEAEIRAATEQLERARQEQSLTIAPRREPR